jgi:hypothetical protein
MKVSGSDKWLRDDARADRLAVAHNQLSICLVVKNHLR